MQIARSPGSVTDPLIETLKLMSDPAKFKAYVKTLEDAVKKFNSAKKEHDNAAYVAKTVDQADTHAVDRAKEINTLEAKRSDTDKKRKAQLASLEASISRREGAHQMVVKEHEDTNMIVRDELSKLARSLATREGILERSKKQLAQDNTALKTEKDALSERRARLAQALKN